MTARTSVIAVTAVLMLAGFGGTYTRAQSGSEPGQPAVSQHYQLLYGLMQDMSEQMAKMTEDMSQGPLTPAQRKHMSQSMERMSEMMRGMSGLIRSPDMKSSAAYRQMDQMRKQMDEMKRSHKMFIVNPFRNFDEAASAFMPTHPPIAKRIERLQNLGAV